MPPGAERVDAREAEQGRGEGTLAIDGEGRLAEELRELAMSSGYRVGTLEELDFGEIDLLVDAAVGRLAHPALEEEGDVPRCILLADGSLAELDELGGAVGFHALPPLTESRVVELTRDPQNLSRVSAARVLGVARNDVARAGERSNLAQHGARELQDIGAGREFLVTVRTATL